MREEYRLLLERQLKITAFRGKNPQLRWLDEPKRLWTSWRNEEKSIHDQGESLYKTEPYYRVRNGTTAFYIINETTVAGLNSVLDIEPGRQIFAVLLDYGNQSPKNPSMNDDFNAVKKAIIGALREYQATYDELTTLLSRRAFGQRAQVMLGELGAEETLYYMAIDIDHFKQINDTAGHAGGDLVLQTFARRIKTVAQGLAASGIEVAVGRPGGEEFALAIKLSKEKKFVTEVVERLQKCVRDPGLPTDAEFEDASKDIKERLEKNPFQGTDRKLAFSGGFSSVLQKSDDNSRLRSRMESEADQAVYRAKASGRDRAVNYEDIVKRYGRILLHHDSGLVAIDLGTNVGVKKGNNFKVYHPDCGYEVDYVKSDGRSQKTLGKYPKHASAEIEVEHAQEEMAFCKVIESAFIGRISADSHLELLAAPSKEENPQALAEPT